MSLVWFSRFGSFNSHYVLLYFVSVLKLTIIIIAMVIHVLGYLATIILMPVMAHDKHDANYVFTEFINNSGWTYSGVAFCAGMMTSLYGFGGIESAAHFAVSPSLS